MEQNILREFEKKCIQTEPAYCTAQCPFHMDIKTFTEHMTNKDLESAFKIIEKSLPLPEIMARICDHPCENSCIRKNIDSPVQIGALERKCVLSRSKRKKRFMLPSKGKRVGIWGSGLSSLTTAFDLILKGYEVTVHDTNTVFGGNLLNLPETILPRSIVAQEINILESYGVRFISEASMTVPFFQQQTGQFDALYLGFDSAMGGGDDIYFLSSNENIDARADHYNTLSCYPKPDCNGDYNKISTIDIDLFSLQTGEPHIFAGGFTEIKDSGTFAVRSKKSVGKMENIKNIDLKSHTALNNITTGKYGCLVSYAAQGRKAATSIDRFISNVSITAGREKEGSCPTRLSTDISTVKPVLPIVPADPEKGYDIDESAAEAQRCIQCDCSRCIRVCVYIDKFKGYPGRYAREIYNNAAIVMGEKKANLLINSCSLCNLCETVCPNDFSMAQLCLLAREEMVEKGKMPVAAHEFALKEMEWASGESCFFARHEPGYDKSARIFFPGCQLLGSAPFQVEKVYSFLRNKFNDGTGFVSGCCGAPAQWAGKKELLKENIESFRKFWEASGYPIIITACTSCTQMIPKQLKGINIVSLFELMAESTSELTANMSNLNVSHIDLADIQKSDPTILSDSIKPSAPVCIIDPCTARDDLNVQKSVRQLVKSVGVTISELPASREMTECCGFGGLVYNANPPLAREIIQKRAARSENDFLAYCSMCRDRLASVGKKVMHLLDLFWPETDHPEHRKNPGFSRRHDNLAMIKNHMLEHLWNEKGIYSNNRFLKIKDTQNRLKQNDKDAEQIYINISSRVEQILEERYILRADIEKVLNHFVTGARHFIVSENRHFIAFYRHAAVCFWVEFKKEKTTDGSAYEIINAWSHRMEVIGNSQFAPGKPTEPDEKEILCSSCNQTLDYYKNHAEYLGSRFDVALPQCNKCGMIFISESLANGKMAEVEKILEDK